MPDKSPIKNISVFIASPGDLEAERREFREVIDQLNTGFADGAGVKFEALGWEDAYASVGIRNQSVINQYIDVCDIFVLVMHRRWGQEAPDAAPYSSYTEEEFHRALNLWNKNKKPKIFVFFKKVDPEQEADAGPQLQKVLNFRKELEASKVVLYKIIDNNEGSFFRGMDSHLRAFVKGDLPQENQVNESILLPIAFREEVNKAKIEVQINADKAHAANLEKEEAILKLKLNHIESAIEASDFAIDGLIEHARQKFIKLISNTNNAEVLSLAFHFFHGTSDFQNVVKVLRGLEETIDLNTETRSAGVVNYFYGLYYNSIGNIQLAENKQLIALKILEKNADFFMQAAVHASLGNIFHTKGELDKAESSLNQSIKIYLELGNIPETPAPYCALGDLYLSKGDYSKAKIMLENALKISTHYKNKIYIAFSKHSLGLLYAQLNDFESAEKMYNKSLGLSEEIGSLLGSASTHLNFGMLFLNKGDLVEAERHIDLALNVYQQSSDQVSLANAYSYKGLLCRKNADMENALSYFETSLAMYQSLGIKSGIANQFANIGSIFAYRENVKEAVKNFQMAVNIFDELGSPQANITRQVMENVSLGVKYEWN